MTMQAARLPHSPHKSLNQHRKADAIVRRILRDNFGDSPSQLYRTVLGFTPGDWNSAILASGYDDASDETRGIVVEWFRDFAGSR